MLALALALALSQNPPAAGEGSAPPAPAPPSAADALVAAAFQPIDTSTPALKPSAGIEPGTFVAPLLALLALIVLAIGVTRRRGGTARSIAIVETASLGPRRSLVIADVLGERLVLGVSEGGIAVLRSTAAAMVAEPAHEPAPRMGLIERLRGRPRAAAFEDALHESIEDQELRTKLAQGFRGVVP